VLVLPATAAAARCALDSGQPCATHALRLVQETGQQQGVVLYQAVQPYGAGSTQALGVVSVALRMEEFARASLSDTAHQSGFLNLCLVDPDSPADHRVLLGDARCASLDAISPSAGPGALRRMATLRFGQQDWPLRIDAGPAFLSQSRDWTAWAVTAICFGAVGLLGAFLLVITGQNRRTQWLVDQRTRELARSNADLQQLAHFDPLTGLFNRTHWTDLAQLTLSDAQLHSAPMAIVFIDIDRFKHINDSLGHSQGDLLLRTLAQRMTASLRSRDVLARLGGDEFVVLLPRLRDPHGARRAAEKLMEALTRPVELDGHTVSVTASLGVACWPEDGDSIEVLVRHADIAMYAAKDSGRNALRFFSADLQERLTEHLLLERELRRALAEDSGELWLEYQPQIHLHSDRVTGLEALMRWKHPSLGAITPDRFIPVAEQCGLIEAVDRWVLAQCSEQLRRWSDQGLPPLRVAVNISAQHIGRSDFLPQLEQALSTAGPTAQHIELEITESMLMQGQSEVRERLLSLTRLGPTLALDDFGTGYSNLGYLKRLPLDKLKIDRSFLVDVPGKPEDEALVRAIVSIARDLGLQVLAEGVETEAQRDFLRQLGCDLMQGWLVSRALPVAELERWLRQRGEGGARPETSVERAEPLALPC
jgi:diguanylate cyclase